MPRLIMRRGPTPGAIFDLESDIISVGRGSKNDIIIRDNEVSREHCQLRRVMDDYELEDFNSSNGTFVNGQRVQAAWLLQTGAIVELGDTITLEYERGVAPKTTGSIPSLEADAAPRREEAQHFSLMITMVPEMGRVYRLNSLIVTVGRDLSNDIVIQDPEVSRFHMRLRRIATGYTVEDMGSTNGTAVNGVVVTQPSELQADDVIRLARQVRLQFVTRSEAINTPIDETIVVGSKRDVRIYSDDKVENTAGGTTAPLTPMWGRTTGMLGMRKDKESIRTAGTPPTGIQIRQTGRMNSPLAPGSLNDSLFIAYARPDWDRVVSSMASSFQQAGIHAWVDQYLVQHGDDWRVALEQALSECWAIVVVVSAQSLASNYVKMSYRYFSAQEKPLVSFVLEPETTLPPDLMEAHAILYDRENPQRSFHKLILEIMHLRR